MKKTVLLITLLTCLGISAQNLCTVNGKLIDKATGEPLVGALVSIEGEQGVGTAANIEGEYSLMLKRQTYTFKAAMLGYKAQVKVIELKSDMRANFELEEEITKLNEVVVVANKDENLLASIGIEKLDMALINTIPVLMGERNILKALQLLPGVKGAGEGNAGFYVRGGTADQNLVLLDDAPVYNATHLFGMFSTFNSDVIDDVTLYKAGMPPSYGGRLSSVLDIRMAEGDKENFHYSGSLGLISSKLSIEG